MALVKSYKKVMKSFENFVPSWFQGVWIIFTCTVLLAILYNPIVSYKTNDTYPVLIPLTPQKINSFGGTPTPVMVGMYIRDYPVFNMLNGKFVVDATIWMRFNPRLISLDRIGEFTFEMAKIEKKSEPHSRIVGDDIIARYDMRISFNAHLNYADFPLDDHRINFTLVHYGLTPSDILFKSSRSNLIVNSEVKLGGWNYVDKRVKTGYVEDKLDPHDKERAVLHPRVVFSLDYERAGLRNIISIFVPLLFIFLTSLFTFSIDPDKGFSSVLGISASAVTGMIGYRFVIENLSPKTGSFMFSDYMFMLFLFCIGVVFFVNLLSRKLSGKVKAIILTTLHMLVLVAIWYAVIVWI